MNAQKLIKKKITVHPITVIALNVVLLEQLKDQLKKKRDRSKLSPEQIWKFETDKDISFLNSLILEKVVSKINFINQDNQKLWLVEWKKNLKKFKEDFLYKKKSEAIKKYEENPTLGITIFHEFYPFIFFLLAKALEFENTIFTEKDLDPEKAYQHFKDVLEKRKGKSFKYKKGNNSTPVSAGTFDDALVEEERFRILQRNDKNSLTQDCDDIRVFQVIQPIIAEWKVYRVYWPPYVENQVLGIRQMIGKIEKCTKEGKAKMSITDRRIGQGEAGELIGFLDSDRFENDEFNIEFDLVSQDHRERAFCFHINLSNAHDPEILLGSYDASSWSRYGGLRQDMLVFQKISNRRSEIPEPQIHTGNKINENIPPAIVKYLLYCAKYSVKEVQAIFSLNELEHYVNDLKNNKARMLEDSKDLFSQYDIDVFN